MLITKCNDDDIFYLETCLIISLIPYLYIVIRSDYLETQIIAGSIILNGTICHLALALQTKYKYVYIIYDVSCNIFFSIFINLNTHWQPYTIAITSTAIVAYILNRSFIGNCWLGIIIHIIFIQWLCLVGIYFYYY